VFKNVQLGRQQKVKLRVEIYNVVNRLQLPAAPNANVLAPASFGRYLF
jgi:hypothetical protein